MNWAKKSRIRSLIVFLAAVAAVAVLVARLSRISRDGSRRILTWSSSQTLSSPQPTSTSPAPPQNSSANVPPTATPFLPAASPTPENKSSFVTGPTNLIIPVAGVRPDQLRDTFSDARSEGRLHDAIDIPAARGTAVLAAADGPILRLFQSERGGTTIYQLSADRRFVYYYAHLDRYADGLTEGRLAKQGETIAYVGDTGNAGAGNYHLHFSISAISDPKRYWEGSNINPYPLLRR